MKKFLTIAIISIITLNANIFCHSLHMGKHGRGHGVSPADVCPIKGACPHHQNNESHSHNGYHEANDTAFIKCDCSQDGNISTIAYEIVLLSNSDIFLTKTFLYNLTEEEQKYMDAQSILLETPPKILS